MTAEGLWVPHSRRKARVYQPRYQRDYLGELAQIDGFHHDWFEGRADKCCLLVLTEIMLIPGKSMTYHVFSSGVGSSAEGDGSHRSISKALSYGALATSCIN